MILCGNISLKTKLKQGTKIQIVHTIETMAALLHGVQWPHVVSPVLCCRLVASALVSRAQPSVVFGPEDTAQLPTPLLMLYYLPVVQI